MNEFDDFPKILYPSYLDKGFTFQIKTEASLRGWQFYAVTLHKVRDGVLVVPELPDTPNAKYVARNPSNFELVSQFLPNQPETIPANTILDFTIDIESVVRRYGFGKYQASIYVCQTSSPDNVLVEDVQRINLFIHKPGRKPVDVH